MVSYSIGGRNTFYPVFPTSRLLLGKTLVKDFRGSSQLKGSNLVLDSTDNTYCRMLATLMSVISRLKS